MKITIHCDCGADTEIRVGEQMLCRVCGKRPSFRYMDVGSYKFEDRFVGKLPIVEPTAKAEVKKEFQFLLFAEYIAITISTCLAVFVSAWFWVLVSYMFAHALFGPLDWCVLVWLYRKLRRR